MHLLFPLSTVLALISSHALAGQGGGQGNSNGQGGANVVPGQGVNVGQGVNNGQEIGPATGGINAESSGVLGVGVNVDLCAALFNAHGNKTILLSESPNNPDQYCYSKASCATEDGQVPCWVQRDGG